MITETWSITEHLVEYAANLIIRRQTSKREIQIKHANNKSTTTRAIRNAIGLNGLPARSKWDKHDGSLITIFGDKKTNQTIITARKLSSEITLDYKPDKIDFIPEKMPFRPTQAFKEARRRRRFARHKFRKSPTRRAPADEA